VLGRFAHLTAISFLSFTIALSASNTAIDLLEDELLAKYKDVPPATIIQVLGAPNGTAERETKEFLTWESNKQAGYYGPYGGAMESSSCKATFEFASGKLAKVSLLGTHGSDRSLCKKLVKPLLTQAPSLGAMAQPTKHEQKSTTTSTQQAVLTNDDIIKLVAAGISDSVILAKIKNTACKFDLSTDALVALKQAAVSNSVIEAMMAVGED
jgi:hypothetical protein